MCATLSRWFVLAVAFGLCACGSQGDVDGTIPRDGQTDVPDRTIVAVRLSSTMTDRDIERNTDSRNIIVTGDLSPGSYSGTIETARFGDLKNPQTVDEFQPGVPAPRDPQQEGEEAEDQTASIGGDNEEDTLVFLLDDDATFKGGEVITVWISSSVNVRGAAMDESMSFSFTIAGGDARADGDFFVESTEPEKESANVGLTPHISATFSRQATADGLADGIAIRGSLSGFHSDATVQGSTTATLRLDRGHDVIDKFIPGETVTVTWNSSIQAAGDVGLSPHLLSLQVGPGEVMDPSAWSQVDLASIPGRLIALLPGDFRDVPLPGEDPGEDRPDLQDVEFVAVTSSSILFSTALPGEWQDTPLAVSGTVKAALAVDTDDDGLLEVLLVTEDASGGRLSAYQLSTDQGGFEETGTAVDFPAKDIQAVLCADLNSDGLPDLAVTHADTTFIPKPAELPGLGDLTGGEEGGETPVDGAQTAQEDPEPENTGHLTILEGQPRPQVSADAELEGILELPVPFSRRGDPIFDFRPAERLEARDLDGDGRLDLMAESSGGLVLYRNQTPKDPAEEQPFEFRRVGFLLNESGGEFKPDAWVALDADRDHDVDILTWTGDGALLHENHQIPRLAESDPAASSPPRGLLFDRISAEPFDAEIHDLRLARGDRVLASNIDGDAGGSVDLLVIRGGGGAKLLLGSPDALGAFEPPIDFPLSGGSSAVALAPVNGDTGLDVLIASGGRLVGLVTDPGRVDDVVPSGRSHFELSIASDTEDAVAVDVVGDIQDDFKGYSVELTYDSSLLNYLRFDDSRISNRGEKDLTACRGSDRREGDGEIQGCDGVPAVRMRWKQSTFSGPASGAHLGRFLFRKLEVEEETTAEIGFKEYADDAQTPQNTVTVVVNGRVLEDPEPASTGDAVTVELDPEPPPRFAISCLQADVEHLGEGYRALVQWRSPRGDTFSHVKIEAQKSGDSQDREEIAVVEWGGESGVPDESGWFHKLIEDGRGGRVTIILTALTTFEQRNDPPEDAPRDSCEIISVFRPVAVGCARGDGFNRITWELPGHAVDRFRVFRVTRGDRGIGFVTGEPVFFSDAEFAFDDNNPSGTAADLYEVAGIVGSVEGPRAGCATSDPIPCTTEDPLAERPRLVQRLRPSDPNRVRFTWDVAESYDRLVATLLLVGSGEEVREVLAGDQTEFVYEGDPDRGGALPGTYRLTLVAEADRSNCVPTVVQSNPVVFRDITVPDPSLQEVELSCLRDEGLGDLLVTWLPPWRGFDEQLALRIRRIVDGLPAGEDTITGILLGDSQLRITEFLGAPLEPIGAYQVTLVATFQGREFTAACQTDEVKLAVGTEDVEAGIGLSGFEIPVTATGVLAPLSGFRFELEYPDFVVIEGFENAPCSGGRCRITVEDLDRLVDPDPDGDRVASGAVELVRLTASIPPELASRARTSECGDVPKSACLDVSNAEVRFEGSAGFRPVDSHGSLLFIRERYAAIEQGVTDAGDDHPVRIAVRLTFDGPPGFDDYKLTAFQLFVRFDPNELELLPYSEEDQLETIVGDKGALIVSFEGSSGLRAANRTGDIKIGWISLDIFRPTLPPKFIEPPVNDEPIFVLFFRSKLPAGSPEVFSRLSFVTDPRELGHTVFLPERTQEGFEPVEGFLDGGILQRSTGPGFGVAAVEPNRGALSGGNRIRVLGRGFPAEPGDAPRVHFISADGDELEADFVDVKSSGEMVVEVPDSGGVAGEFDVRVRAVAGEATLTEAYVYEPLRVVDADVSSVHAAGADLVRVKGTGFAVNPDVVKVLFRVDVGGSQADFEADVVRPVYARPEPDRSELSFSGTELVVRAVRIPPEMEGRTARLVVVQSGTERVLERDFEILSATGEQALAILQVDPESASHCGGETVIITGTGFTESTEVEFDGVPASSVQFRSSVELHADVPFRNETITENVTVTLTVRDGGFLDTWNFELTPPPDFIRGDVDGSGAVNVTDATLLADLVLDGGSRETGQANRDAWDVNDDGVLDFGDSMAILEHLFGGGTPPASPFPDPGQDPDNLSDGICQ